MPAGGLPTKMLRMPPREGLDYIELRYSPWFMAEAHALDPVGVIEAVTDGVRSRRTRFCHTRQPDRHSFAPLRTGNCYKELNALLIHKDYFCGLGPGRRRSAFPGRIVRRAFQTAREAGWHITVHAGEADGPTSSGRRSGTWVQNALGTPCMPPRIRR